MAHKGTNPDHPPLFVLGDPAKSTEECIEGREDPREGIGFKKPKDYAEALAMKGLNKVSRHETTPSRVEVYPLDFDIKDFETKTIGLRITSLEDIGPCLEAYDKRDKYPDTARVFGVLFIKGKLTKDQVKKVVADSEILLSQHQNAA